jgi:hypothetical protein
MTQAEQEIYNQIDNLKDQLSDLKVLLPKCVDEEEHFKIKEQMSALHLRWRRLWFLLNSRYGGFGS